MSHPSRRDLLKSGLAASAASLLPSAAQGSTPAAAKTDPYASQEYSIAAPSGPGPHGWRSGQDSPVHDSDRLYPVSDGQPLILENAALRLAFDRRSGALLEFVNKKTGWRLGKRPGLGESFELFVPIPDRNYSPVLGARNALAAFEISPDGSTLKMTWRNLESEYAGTLNIVLQGTVRLQDDKVSWDMDVANRSPYRIDTVSWPIVGEVEPPAGENQLTRDCISYGTMRSTELSPQFTDQRGYFGTNYPVQISGGAITTGGRFVLVAAKQQGIYVGTHDTREEEIVRYFFELRPGYGDSYDSQVPRASIAGDHPVRIVMQTVHYPFVNPNETVTLSKIVFSPYQGDWHTGVEPYREWKASWFERPKVPAWSEEVHSWQQLQIDSSEDDLRTRYSDLPRRIQQAADNGIAAIQLVGWNRGGQDRGNPSHDTDPRLGTQKDLKDAIAVIQKTGVHMILFSKFPWADLTTDWYRRELIRYAAVDPYGIPLTAPGYQYQTPMQLIGIGERRFAVACTADAQWQELCAREFQKVLDLGATGMLFDESAHHAGAEFCFSTQHGHRTPASLWAGDLVLGAIFRKMVRESVGEDHFLFGGEDPWDVLYKTYSVSYFRISSGHIPVERYLDPGQNMMIAVTGFDDREMINRALMYRYILSYEPFNFKGNLDDFPLTLAYGKKMDALRKRYSAALWQAEFQDTLGATVTVDGQPHADYTVFRQTDGKRSAVVINPGTEGSIEATVHFDGTPAAALSWASPEEHEPHPMNGVVRVEPRSAVVIFEG